MEQESMEQSNRPTWVNRILQTAIYEPISPVPLALFRIAFGLVLLMEVLQFINRRDLVFLESPLRDTLPNQILIALGVWTTSIVCLTLGFLTRLTTLVSYVCTVIFFASDSVFEYHADMGYLPGGLLLAFLPVHRTLSIDAVLSKKIWGVDLSSQPIPRIFNNAVIYFLLAIVYFDSIFYKLTSTFWCGGLGLWLPASVPGMTVLNWNVLLNQEWLVKCAGYLTLVFEVVFLFLYWVPAARIYLFIIGLVLHLGIAIVFPIPLFGLSAMIVYLLLFPDPVLNRLISVFSRFAGTKRKSVPERASPEASTQFLRRDIVLSRFVIVLLIFQATVQASLIAQFPLLPPGAYYWLNRTLAIQRHHVFGDIHFNSTTRETALVYYDKEGREEWLPWVNKEGFVGPDASGRFWVYLLRMSIPGAGKQHVWCARAAESWARQTGRSLEEGYIIVKRRRPNLDRQWERDRLLKNCKIPWSNLIKITWIDGKRHFARIKSR